MNHNRKFNHLGRKSAHRKAMLSNMAASLILHKRISTTVAKAKALKIYVEPLVTKSKIDNQNTRHIIFSYLKQKEAVTELFREITPKVINRPGGYTRVLKTGNRLGDNAATCIIEFVDFNETYTEVKSEKKTSTRRRRSKKSNSTSEAKKVKEVKAEAKEVKATEVKAEAKEVKATEVKAEAKEVKAPAVKGEAPKADSSAE